MRIDLSVPGDEIAVTRAATMHAALDVTRAPVIWSHSCARALVDQAMANLDSSLEENSVRWVLQKRAAKTEPPKPAEQ